MQNERLWKNPELFLKNVSQALGATHCSKVLATARQPATNPSLPTCLPGLPLAGRPGLSNVL